MIRATLLVLALFLAPGLLGAAPAYALTVGEVVDLLQAGVGESVILDQIAADHAQFRLEAPDILSLKEAGASDDLIRAMIRAGSEAPAGEPQVSSDVSGSRGLYSDALEDSYASPGVRVNVYYDPFGYYWYSSPWSFAYYYPFSWVDCGFYYAGWWDHRWWRSGSWCLYYRDRYCGHGHGWGGHGDFAFNQGHSAWDRNTGRNDRRPAWDRSGAGPGADRRDVIRRDDNRGPRTDRHAYTPPARPSRTYTRGPSVAPRSNPRPPDARGSHPRVEAPRAPRSSGPSGRAPAPDRSGSSRGSGRERGDRATWRR